MRVAFLGNDPWSVPPLRALVGADDIDVALVVTNPPRPAGRGSKPRSTSVAHVARELDLPFLEVARVREGAGFEALGSLEPDALVVVAYGEILTPGVLDLARLGAVNVHFSLLPRWRGAAPVQHAILEGDEVTGVTVMLMDEGMDTGPILLAEETPIGPEEDARVLGQRLAGLGAPLLVDALRGLHEGSIEPRSQDHATATSAPKLTTDDRTIDWGSTSDAIVRKVRAFAPEPGALTTFRELPLKIVTARDLGSGGGGMIADRHIRHRGRAWADEGRVIVGADPGRVELLEVVPSGRKRMSAAEWARGARIEPGEGFG